MSFYLVFSMLICAFSVLLYVMRFFLVLCNRVRISFLENDITMCSNSTQEQRQSETKEELVSILAHISHADFIVPLFHNIRKQNYKNIELLVMVSHADIQVSRSLKNAIITSHREYISHIPLLVFVEHKNAQESLHLLASAARGEYLCMLDQRTRLSPKSISLMMKAMLLRGVNVLSVIPNLFGSSKLLQSYAAMTHTAFSMRGRLPYVIHGASNVFSCMCAGDYYKYFLYGKGHKRYTHDSKDMREISYEDSAYVRLLHSKDVFHAHMFSSEVTYHMFSPYEYLRWFVDAFRFMFCNNNIPEFGKDNTSVESKNSSLRLKSFENCSELIAFFYALLLIVLHIVMLFGMFVKMHSYAIVYVIICIISFTTHYVCVRSYGVHVYMAILQWLLSPIPYFHTLFTLCLRIVRRSLQKHGHTL